MRLYSADLSPPHTYTRDQVELSFWFCQTLLTCGFTDQDEKIRQTYNNTLCRSLLRDFQNYQEVCAFCLKADTQVLLWSNGSSQAIKMAEISYSGAVIITLLSICYQATVFFYVSLWMNSSCIACQGVKEGDVCKISMFDDDKHAANVNNCTLADENKRLTETFNDRSHELLGLKFRNPPIPMTNSSWTHVRGRKPLSSWWLQNWKFFLGVKQERWCVVNAALTWPSLSVGGANMPTEKRPNDLRSNKNDNGVDQSMHIISFDLPTSCDKNPPRLLKTVIMYYTPTSSTAHKPFFCHTAASYRSTGQIKCFSHFLQFSAWPYSVPFNITRQITFKDNFNVHEKTWTDDTSKHTEWVDYKIKI